MKASEFCYWLQSAFELCDAKTFNEAQTAQIKNHLALVFVHDLDPKESAQTGLSNEEMQKIHDGLVKPVKQPKKYRPRPGGGGFGDGIQYRC